MIFEPCAFKESHTAAEQARAVFVQTVVAVRACLGQIVDGSCEVVKDMTGNLVARIAFALFDEQVAVRFGQNLVDNGIVTDRHIVTVVLVCAEEVSLAHCLAGSIWVAGNLLIFKFFSSVLNEKVQRTDVAEAPVVCAGSYTPFAGSPS